MLIDDAAYRKALPYLAATSVLLVSAVMVMLGPLLVPIAAEFEVSVAVAGQLAAATSLVWGLAAIPIGAISDTIGRRRVLLAGLLAMSAMLALSTLAASFGQLFLTRILTGLAAAMIPPTCYAACADLRSPPDASRAMSWALAGGMLGGALGMPLVAWLASHGDWRSPFLVLSGAMLAMALCVWATFPRHVRAEHAHRSYVAHLRELGNRGAALWLLVAVNFLLQAASWGTLSYLPAFLMQTYQRPTGDLALPLLANGIGIVTGALLGGRIAAASRRATIAVAAIVMAGLLLACAFATTLTLWASVALTATAGGLFVLAQPMIMATLFAHAGEARGTVSGLLALSTQIGAMGGAGLGGAMLSMAGFPGVGAGCLTLALTGSALLIVAQRRSA